ncbi:MAG: DUF177 domain-containing protein [Candidatus Omnitrophica bacterium]|nr:DUF177 domain-containing protein [Candidatus Omnitrophota bacterium]MDD5592824.1 DUF177 domain-containing protein [Candidatus Omnitrophota bacterium]
MKIDINKIPLEGLIIEEEVSPAKLDLDTDSIKFQRPIKVRADISKITNAVTARLSLEGTMHLICGRCLSEFEIELKKDFELGYQADKFKPLIDLDQDIKEEIILDYPLKPLCRPDCKGLCPKCGKDLNEGACNCR